jgi:cellulose synthase/poly-beta-1,6-N-acetylglucosamine synthase-like glycosyltransferase
MSSSAPTVSVIIPCRNEVRTITQVLRDLDAQAFSDTFEVIIADGMSDDGTRELLAELQQAKWDFELYVIDNPERYIPCALNRAVAASRGTYIVRVDGHARIGPTYLTEIVHPLRTGLADVVGPRIQLIAGSASPIAQAIAVCSASALGSGGTASRRPLTAPVDVSHAVMSCYRRDVWERNGGYDEALLSNEDFDFDMRAARQGARILALPSPTFSLVARATIGTLAQQRWRYGWWKGAVLHKMPTSLHLRQAIPVLALIALVALVVATALGAVSPTVIIWSVVVYCGIAIMTAFAEAKHYPSATSLVVATIVAPVIFAIIHGVWACGVCAGLVVNPRR